VSTGPPRRNFTLADVMVLVAATAGLFTLFQACDIRVPFEPIQAIFTTAALFLCFGGYGGCTARWRGRSRLEGFCWGFIFGPLGVLMIGLMPNRARPPQDARVG
jgi:hypothetical protein